MLLLAVGGLAPSTATAAFEARGGIRHAYVLDAKRGQRLELVNAQGRVVSKGRADRLGSKIFRNVAPGRGYSVRRHGGWARYTGARPSVCCTRDRTRSGRSIRRKTLKQGLNYVKMRDGVELAMTVRLPRGKTLADGPFPTLIEYSGYQVAAPHDLFDSVLKQLTGGSSEPDPLAPATRHGCRLPDRADARLRRRERADARLGLLGRRLRPLRPADDL